MMWFFGRNTASITYLKNTKLRWVIATVLAMTIGSTAQAHKPSDSYLRIRGGNDVLTAQWDIALKDLEFIIGLDANQDGDVTWGELKDKRDAISAHALSRLRIAADETACGVEVTELKVTEHSDGSYAVLELATDAAGDSRVLKIEYSLLFDVDPTHRGLVLYENGANASTYVLSPTDSTLEIDTSESGLLKTFVTYVGEGVWHIWIGFDHILFLISLLLPAVLVLKDKAWRPVEEFKPALRTVTKVVTVFTIAHSITLWLAVMDYVTIPSQLIEATIAFSIIVTALNNLYPVLPFSSWVIAFAFGLIHGFGFANVLLDLGLSNVTLGVSLFGFNVGVELGQLTIVLVFLPFAYLLRRTEFYKWGIFRLGSVVVVVVASIWMYERVFNTEILGF